MRRVAGPDVVVAAAFVVGTMVETVVIHGHDSSALVLHAAGSLALGLLALRRVAPFLCLTGVSVAGAAGSLTTVFFLHEADDGGGVWLLALMLAAFSFGQSARGRHLAWGVLMPLAVVLAADLPTRTSWDLLNGVLFVSLGIGLGPTVAGRLVRLRRERLEVLRTQQRRIREGQEAERRLRVMAERVRMSERLGPVLRQELQEVGSRAETGIAAHELEAQARALLARVRGEVVALTAPVPAGTAEPPPVGYLAALRAAAQPWVVAGAGAAAVGLALEATHVLLPSAAAGPVVVAGAAVAFPFALLWWRPVLAAILTWGTLAAFSHTLAPLGGTLTATALALGLAFAVSALSTRRWAMVGLLVCLAGQIVGVGTDDPLGDGVVVLFCWLGGLTAHEAGRLVELTKDNRAQLIRQQALSVDRAVVDERLRLARSLHDSLGHSLTIMTLHAGAARRLADTHPELATEAVRTLARVAREAERLLEEHDSGGDLTELVETTRAAGLPVRATIQTVSLSDTTIAQDVYRIVQEALTNVLQHAPGAATSVTVAGGSGRCHVSVVNAAGHEPGVGSGTGQGLPSIAARARAAGGSATWGPRDDGGFEVAAELPLRRPAVFT